MVKVRLDSLGVEEEIFLINRFMTIHQEYQSLKVPSQDWKIPLEGKVELNLENFSIIVDKKIDKTVKMSSRVVQI